MAMELERQIMYEIGFWGHYSAFNGTSTCKPIRNEAARRLSKIIEKYHKAGEEIDRPNLQITRILEEIAQRSDKEDWQLTKTWQAASDIIATHIHLAKTPKKKKDELYARFRDYLQQQYLR